MHASVGFGGVRGISESVAAAFKIDLAGPFSTQVDGKPLPALSRRSQAMLAYLACQPAMRAERGLVADLLWSDRSEEQARASLRQELSVLRRALPDGVLEADRQAVWLDPARVEAAGTGGGADFLKGFDLASEGFEDWLRDMRARDGARPAPALHAAAPHAARSRPTLAVLPFEELGAAETDMFADGVVEEITGALSRVHDFDVIARQSAFALQGQGLTIPEAAARLGADYVVEGSVRRAGERVRIAVQLVHGADARTLWSERFDDRLDDLFEMQDRIAAQVAGQVSPSLRSAEIARISGAAPGNRTAYELTLLALRPFWSHSRQGNLTALGHLDAALAVDPRYGPALALRAWCLGQEHTYMYSADPASDRARAVAAIEAAAPHVGDHALSLTALGAALSLSTTDLDRANHYIDRALVLDPNNAWAWMRRGWASAFVGDVERSLAAMDRAEALSPLDPFRFNMILGRAATHYHWRGEDGAREAVTLIRRAIHLNPEAKWIYRMLATACVYAGDLDAATVAVRDLLDAYPHLTIRYLNDTLPRAAFTYENPFFTALRQAGIPLE
jgi:TolB-like protein/Flp pilus assembly protein TadD